MLIWIPLTVGETNVFIYAHNTKTARIYILSVN